VISSVEMADRSTDGELVRRCLAGEEAAWNELVERYSRYVYAIASQGYRLPLHDAEDVFQDVFLRAYDGLDRLRDAGALRPWLGQLTRRTCLDRLASAARESPAETIEPPGIAETLLGIEEAIDVHEALAELGPPCSEILDRFFARDESYRTIGEALELPGGTIASRISRCLAKLRQQLEGRNDAAETSGHLMRRYGFDEELLGELLRRLPPPPQGWVEAAQELPRARRVLDNIVTRAEADLEYRRAVLADLEAALAASGLQAPTPTLAAELRRRFAHS
jgi:RNA polymerase sigma factor (sigma-70 family)